MLVPHNNLTQRLYHFWPLNVMCCNESCPTCCTAGGLTAIEAPSSSSRMPNDLINRLLISLTAHRCLLKLDCPSSRTMNGRCNDPTCVRFRLSMKLPFAGSAERVEGGEGGESVGSNLSRASELSESKAGIWSPRTPGVNPLGRLIYPEYQIFNDL
jgi:hypothetical protein